MSDAAHKFMFEMGDRVKLAESKETGKVVARAEYRDAQNDYLILYQAGDGRQTQSWWGESALTVDDE